MDARADKDKIEFHRQLEEAHRLREFAYSIAEGKHHGHFERKDYIALTLLVPANARGRRGRGETIAHR